MPGSCRVLPWTSLVVLALAVGAPAAPAQTPSTPVPASTTTPAEVAFDDPQVDLTEAEGGGWEAKVGATNLTTQHLEVAATAKDKACSLRTDTGDGKGLLAGRHMTVTVKIDAACDAGAPEAGYPFTLTAGSASIAVTAKAKSDAAIDWSPFVAFLAAVGAAAFVVLLVVWPIYDNIRKKKGWTTPSAPLTPLKGLDKSWSFKDSWLSSVTAGAGLALGVLGSSDFLKAALGDKAEATVGAATVAGLVGAALTGAAGVLVLAIKRPGTPGITIAGLLSGSAVAFAAAGGQVWTVAVLLSDVDLGFGDAIVWVAAVAATAMLIAYACTSLLDLLLEGTKPDEAAPPAAAQAVTLEVLAAPGEPPPLVVGFAPPALPLSERSALP